MPTIESVVHAVNKQIVPQFERKLRSYLVEQDKDWLIEQIVRLTLDAHSLAEMDRKIIRRETEEVTVHPPSERPCACSARRGGQDSATANRPIRKFRDRQFKAATGGPESVERPIRRGEASLPRGRPSPSRRFLALDGAVRRPPASFGGAKCMTLNSCVTRSLFPKPGHARSCWGPRERLREERRAERAARLREMELDEEKLDAFIRRYGGYDRPRLIERGYLADDPPPKGTAMLSWKHRSGAGERLLTKSKDVLFALLFGDESTNTRFDRVERELLTMTLPRFKAEALDFMQASTEVSALGTWRDPEHTADDTSADDVLLQVEYGEVASELIGNGIVRTLSLINSLEMNEQVVYARMVNVEQSTLIT